MTHTEMLKKLIDSVEAMTKAKDKYNNHRFSGNSQKIKKQLFKEYNQKWMEMNNAVFNIKQLIR